MTQPAANAVDVAAPHLPCLRCGYDLRGLPADGACPECGLRVAVTSGSDGEGLRHAPPGWIGSLAWGARLALVAVAAHLAVPYLPEFAFSWVPDDYLSLSFGVTYAALTALYAVGAWLLTRRRRFSGRQGAWRLPARFVALLPLFPEVVAFLPRRPPPLNLLREPGVIVLLWCAAPSLLLLHLRHLALRLPSPRLARCCAAGAAGFATAAVVHVVYAALGLTPASGLELVMAIAALVGFIALVVALAWAAVAFAVARRAARSAWGES